MSMLAAVREVVAAGAAALGMLIVAAGAVASSHLDVPAPESCRSAEPMFLQGGLHLAAVSFEGEGFGGYDVYACLRDTRRPDRVGSSVANDNGSYGDNARYVFDGTRYLATTHESVGEGGADVSHIVLDLQTRKAVISEQGSYPPAPIRVASDGSLVSSDGRQIILHRAGRRMVRLSGDAIANQLALAGDTVYWSEPGAPKALRVARSYAIPEVGPGPENVLFDDATSRLDENDPCADRRGRTLAAAGPARVFSAPLRSGGRGRFACHVDGEGFVRLGGAARSFRIAANRWLLTRGGGTMTVIDIETRDVVTRLDGRGVQSVTLLPTGALAWITADGTLLGKSAIATEPTVLATAEQAPSKLASSTHTVYWTAADGPHGVRPDRRDTAG